jgi:hypothetical protein
MRNLGNAGRFELPISLKMKRTATPLLGSDIGDGFGEVPAVTVKILGVVLAFAVGMILRFTQDNSAVLLRALAVTLGIFNADLNVLRVVGGYFAFGDGEAAIASLHLYAVIGDAKTNSEAKSFCQPIGSYAWVRVNQHRNHGARRHGPVESHLETLSFISKQQDYQAPGFLGTAYTGFGREAKAAAAYARSIEVAKQQLSVNPGDVRALYMGAVAWARIGRRKEALA